MYQPDYIRVVYKNLPEAVHGFTLSEDSEFYTIVLNARLSREMQVETYEHEMSHIENRDFSRMQDIYKDIMDDTDATYLEAKRHKGKK